MIYTKLIDKDSTSSSIIYGCFLTVHIFEVNDTNKQSIVWNIDSRLLWSEYFEKAYLCILRLRFQF